MVRSVIAKIKFQFVLVVVTFGYVGLIPKAPGTWGSLAAIPLAYLVWNQSGYTPFMIILLLFGIGVWASHYYEVQSGTHDSGKIVIDEVVGMLITTYYCQTNFWHYGIAFMLFRFFDIIKPPPIRWFDQKCPGGFGVMIDDVIAAIIALPFLWLGIQLFQSIGIQ